MSMPRCCRAGAGAAPIQRAILAGDRESGITIMQMDQGLDTGPMLLRRAIEIGPRETGASLHDRLASLGAELIVEALEGSGGRAPPADPQPAEGATYAAKLTREEERLDWREPAVQLDRRVRALAPRPGAWCEIAGERVKVLEAEAVEGQGLPGHLIDDRLTDRLRRGGVAPAEAPARRQGGPGGRRISSAASAWRPARRWHDPLPPAGRI